MSSRYDDILHLPHPTSKRHPRMPMATRAAQFAPFAALTGYDAAIRETARLTDERIEQDEGLQADLAEKLRWLADHPHAAPTVQATWFCPDERKTGGAYRTVSGVVKKLDSYARLLWFDDGTRIPLDALAALEGECFAAPEAP